MPWFAAVLLLDDPGWSSPEGFCGNGVCAGSDTSDIAQGSDSASRVEVHQLRRVVDVEADYHAGKVKVSPRQCSSSRPQTPTAALAIRRRYTARSTTVCRACSVMSCRDSSLMVGGCFAEVADLAAVGGQRCGVAVVVTNEPLRSRVDAFDPSDQVGVGT